MEMVGEMGRVEAVIWGQEILGFGWVLVCFWLENCCSGSGVFVGVLVGVLFDYLYLLCGLYWWVSVYSVGGLSGFGGVDIALFTWCFVVVCG